MSWILVGYRGCGKTTVGRLLADRHGVSLVDTDGLVVESAGMPIRELFAKFGEGHFRDLESQALQRALSSPTSIISTGGGIVMREQNRLALRSAGRPVVYLFAPAEKLHQRIEADENSVANRPHLTALGGGLAEVQHLLAIRDPLYREVADTVVEVTDLSPEQIAHAILRGCEPPAHHG